MIEFDVQIGNIGVTNKHCNKVQGGMLVNVPEVYAREILENGTRNKYTLAFYDVNVSKEEVTIKYVLDRPFHENIDADEFKYLLQLGYRIIQHALTVGIDLH